MNKLYLSAIALLLGSMSFMANATVMTLETRSFPSPSTVSGGDYISAFNNRPASTVNYINDFTGVQTGNNSISHLNISFDAFLNGSWGIRLGLDAGHGAALFVNGTEINKDTTDLWWQYNWNHPDVLTGNTGIAPGSQSIDLYWGENCCNGYSSGQFTTDNGQTWQALSVANIDAATDVSEPATLALLGLV